MLHVPATMCIYYMILEADKRTFVGTKVWTKVYIFVYLISFAIR